MILKGLDSFFASHLMSSFNGSVPENVNDVPESTRFMQKWMVKAFEERLSKLGQNANIRAQYLSFDGYGSNQGPVYDRGYADYGGPKNYFRMSKIATRKVIDGLIELAGQCGESITRDHFYSNHIQGNTFGSTKLVHFDLLSEIAALQRKTVNVNGGNTRIYDLGSFCKDKNLMPWDLLVPYAPLRRELPSKAQELEGTLYLAMTVRPEYVKEITNNYSVLLPVEEDCTVIFNNGIYVDLESREVLAFAHGADATSTGALAIDPQRTIILSYAFKDLTGFGQ